MTENHDLMYIEQIVEKIIFDENELERLKIIKSEEFMAEAYDSIIDMFFNKLLENDKKRIKRLLISL